MKLFRRLTGNAPRPDSFASYFKYALGEIVLVVAGILIAVSLNNWNEGRKNTKALNQIFGTIAADLAHDLEETSAALEYYELRKPAFERVLAGELTREDYLEKKAYAFLLIGYPEVSFHSRGFELLKAFKGTISEESRELVGTIVTFYTERAVEVAADDKLRAEDFAENFSHFKANMPWWADLIHQQKVDGFIPYALNDPDYRNRVATTRFLAYFAFVPELETFEERAKALRQAIAEARGED